jgi:outer membrane protein assembly factor BamB
MNKRILSTCLLVVIGLAYSNSVSSQQIKSTDWNQFRGFNRDGISLEADIPTQHSESWPKLVWKKDIGSAFSEITVSGDKIYTMVSERVDSTSGFEYIAAFEESTGNEIWRSQVDSIFIDIDGWGNGPRSTPTFDEENIYSFSSFGKLTANSRKDGKQLWQIDFIKEFGSTRPRWGFSTSPLLIDDLIIMEAGGTDLRAFIAFDKKTGEIKWTKANGVAHYDSPVVANFEGQKQIIFANGRTIYSYDSNGDTLWTYNSPIVSPMGMPVVIEQNKIFISAIRSIGFIIIEINDNKPKEVLRGSTMKTDFSSCIYYNGNVYGFHIAALQCISAETGEKKWTKRGFGKGSFILVNDKLLVLSDKGKLIQIEATSEIYKEQGSFQAINGKSWTAPSYSNGKLYVRNLTEMACYIFK